MKFCYWDIETAPMEVLVFDAKTRYVPHDHVEEPTSIICATWKYSDDNKIHQICVKPQTPRDDLKVVERLNKELNYIADNNIVLVHQNGDQFDYKKVRARNRIHKLPPLPRIKKDLVTIDTLKEARKSGFDYNRQDYLDKIFSDFEHGKVETRGWVMWRDIVSKHSSLKKRKIALKEMLEYNEGDILGLERIFKVMKPDIDLPNHHLRHGEVDGCPQCGSKDYVKQGVRYTATRAYQSYRCRDCGKRFQDTHSLRTTFTK